MTSPSSSGSGLSFLGPRYRLVRALAQGGFGHTYLAEDTHRFNELCVLKELAPQVEGEAALQKAKQLFEREAGVLYKLQHPQIPRFRELLRVGASAGHLFLVQDYIEGPTYRDLLDTRCRYGAGFNETEVMQLLAHLLPVLAYIHGVGVIHRDISPENLILRNADGLPVLIDFGGVKQVSATAEARFGGSAAAAANVTRLGKLGYAPVEQLHQGSVTPASDLYSLAVTVVVLLTGQNPQDLYDDVKATWHWRSQAAVSNRLGQTLDQMLSPQPQNRYPSAAAVMAALNLSAQTRPHSSRASAIATVAVGRPLRPSTFTPSRGTPEARAALPTPLPLPEPRQAGAAQPKPRAPRQTARPTSGRLSALIQVIISLGLVAGSVAVVWWVAAEWQPESERLDLPSQAEPGDSPPDGEQSRQQQLRDRRQALGIDNRSLVAMTDQLFYDRYPNLVGQPLTDAPEDATLRSRWHRVATDLLDQLETFLSAPARQRLGSYQIDNLDDWTERLSQRSVSRRALNALADAQFQRLFPDQAAGDFLDQPVGQVWYALAEDRMRRMEAGEGVAEVTFAAGTADQQIAGQLAPGEGQIYTLYLSAGQRFSLDLQAPRNSTRLSVYLPQPSADLPYLLSLSRDRSWAGELPQTGYYEVMIVSNRDRTFEYQLTLSTD